MRHVLPTEVDEDMEEGELSEAREDLDEILEGERATLLTRLVSTEDSWRLYQDQDLEHPGTAIG